MNPDRPTERFADRAADYARFRPTYPAAAVDAILDGAASHGPARVADVGAGTGILSRLLAARGARVTAVEPNAAMCAAAATATGVSFVAGTAEATGLPGGAFDVVTVAQAFHWFDVPRALAEFARLLRPGGRLAILWNRRSRVDPFSLGYRRVLEAMHAEAPAQRSTFDPAVVAPASGFDGHRMLQFRNEHVVTEAGLLGLAMSTSTVPRDGPRHARIMQLLAELHAAHRQADGAAALVYDTDVYLWRRA
ncbi:MAG: class I SAM-dependent methyltransferase [Planctomycetes bacterium]|nr:class I SAM-dependent methyltransferase [Planctomycetota bacterium]